MRFNKTLLDRCFRRDPDSNKYTNGHCLVIGGSADYTGAVFLAARSALRSGCGMVTAGVPDSLSDIFKIKLTEELILPLKSKAGYLSSGNSKKIIDFITEKKVTSIVIGPGMSCKSPSGVFFKEFLNTVSDSDIPAIVDADGIYHLSRMLSLNRLKNIIITPHAGELARFLGKKKEEIALSRIGFAQKAALKIRGVSVLKGKGTLITDGNQVFTDKFGTAALAVSGTGDVLAGILGGILSKYRAANEIDLRALFNIACLGVTVHSVSGLLANKKRRFGVIASDIIEEISAAIEKTYKV